MPSSIFFLPSFFLFFCSRSEREETGDEAGEETGEEREGDAKEETGEEREGESGEEAEEEAGEAIIEGK
jgi:hypothetical protein